MGRDGPRVRGGAEGQGVRVSRALGRVWSSGCRRSEVLVCRSFGVHGAGVERGIYGERGLGGGERGSCGDGLGLGRREKWDIIGI